MHETAFIARLLHRLEQAGRAAGAVRVTSVRVRIGECAGVEPRRLLDLFQAQTRGTIAQGAMLTIERISLQALCETCGEQFPMVRYEFECPACASRRVRVVAGEEFVLESVTVVTGYEATLTRWH